MYKHHEYILDQTVFLSEDFYMKKPGFLLSMAPIIFLVAALAFNVTYFGDNSSYGPNQIALFFSAMFAACIGFFKLKMPYKELEQKSLSSITDSMQAIVILLIVGMLIGLWILSGVVPAMIYYGVKLINPTFFLPVCLILCAIVSLATGSSWTTAGTIGIALIGIGKTIGISEPMVAGAVISGAYFGDKLSPLSDTTNLAPAMAGTDLFTHIRHMTYTTIPAILIALFSFIFIGLSQTEKAISTATVDNVLSIIQMNFNVTPWLFTLPLIVFLLVKNKVSAIASLSIGSIAGGAYALFFQMDLLSTLSPSGGHYQMLIETAYRGFKLDTGNEMIDSLFNRGGMESMLNTIWLIIMAMFFGGMLEATGMLKSIADWMLSFVKNVGSLVATTVCSALFLNITTSDQYISIVVTGRMFKNAYNRLNLAPQNLSRAVEDGATVTSVLVPWNSCGAYFSAVLGVGTLSYLPFAFFNILSPIISILVGFLGYTMVKKPVPPE
jgi:Na+:H+ antiporter, NhaC family